MNLFVILIGLLFFFLAFGTPIFSALGLSTIITMDYAGDSSSFLSIIQKMFSSIDSFSLLALPLFVLSGSLMEYSGISERLVKFMRMCFKRLPAASACIDTISCTFFGALSGSAPATSAAIGSVMIKPMKDKGYTAPQAAAVNAVSSSLGIIIPPSIPMVVLATTASLSVGTLFMSGVVPGLLICLAFCIMHSFRFRHIEARDTTKLSRKEVVKISVDAIAALIMPLIILGGIYGGIFTPTEASAVACVYAWAVGALLYKKLPFKVFLKCLANTAVSVGSMLIIVCSAAGMAWWISSSGLGQAISDAVLSTFHNKYVVLLIINLFLFVLGCLIDPTSIILLTSSIIFTITNKLGIHPIAVGCFMIVNIALGMVTPPLAGTLYVSNQIAGEKTIGPMVKELIPYIILFFLLVLLITYIPGISLSLPKLLGMI